MKVKDLIEWLKEVNSEALVVRKTHIEEEYTLVELPKVTKAIVSPDGPELWNVNGAKLLEGDKVVPVILFEKGNDE